MKNNFDLVRLVAALQVFIVHASEHFKLSYEGPLRWAMYIVKLFPGVSVFFTVSGFLIMWSYDRNKNNLKQFYRNRALRIFPALWLSVMVGFFLLISFQIIHWRETFSWPIMAWLFTQLSFFQFYTPEVLRSFGVGTPNGSLWTISVELQFYLLVPFLYWCLFKGTKVRSLVIIFLVMGASVLFYFYALSLQQESMLSKLSGVFVLPYLYNFLFGILIYKYWNSIHHWLQHKGVLWLLFYIAYGLCFAVMLDWYKPTYWPNALGFIGNVLLAFTTIALAYSKENLSDRWLQGNDFSYGIYIYHMLVINVWLEAGWEVGKFQMIIVGAITISLAALSWFSIEKPVLKWNKTKRYKK